MGRSQADGFIIPQDPGPSPGAKTKSKASRVRDKSNSVVEPKSKTQTAALWEGGEKSYRLHKRGMRWELAPWENSSLRQLAVRYVFTNRDKRTEKAQKEDSASCWPVGS